VNEILTLPMSAGHTEAEIDTAHAGAAPPDTAADDSFPTGSRARP